MQIFLNTFQDFVVSVDSWFNFTIHLTIVWINWLMLEVPSSCEYLKFIWDVLRSIVKNKLFWNSMVGKMAFACFDNICGVCTWKFVQLIVVTVIILLYWKGQTQLFAMVSGELHGSWGFPWAIWFHMFCMFHNTDVGWVNSFQHVPWYALRIYYSFTLED